MKEHTRKCSVASKVVFEELEEFLRQFIESRLQEMLEAELRAYLGRKKHARRKDVDASKDYRNGYGKPRRLSLRCGTVTLQRPRTRCLEGRFESGLLPLFQRWTPEVRDLIPDLYLHGLASGDFDLALRGLLGDDAPLSASTVMRLKAKWQAEYEEWKQRPLASEEVVYLWVDGVYVKAGLEKEKAALLGAIGALRDGRKVVLTVESGHRESVESWSALLRGLKERGMNCPRLVIGDGHLGIWGALTNVYPETAEQSVGITGFSMFSTNFRRKSFRRRDTFSLPFPMRRRGSTLKRRKSDSRIGVTQRDLARQGVCSTRTGSGWRDANE